MFTDTENKKLSCAMLHVVGNVTQGHSKLNRLVGRVSSISIPL